eukprot:CAMPEP_0197921008 /NCGR_PEP_ID=MMETSP1439-20131203/89922_1 /TAXON_ID=66791 /ORGANISM="Gonyaulax spinifera, Strain CCMP409" /LENGTH=31 /DNA_ID= /DNA_START= /DNA_END= /DNA_ORIENTATION=
MSTESQPSGHSNLKGAFHVGVTVLPSALVMK